MKVVLLEDDHAQAELLQQWLVQDGYTVAHYDNCRDFISGFDNQLADLVILDWQLPDGSGVEVLDNLRSIKGCEAPILFTTQRDTELDIVSALQKGADDYLVKPLRKGELVARLNALGRRAGIESPSNKIELGNIVLDKDGEVVTVDGDKVKMTRKDFLVAKCLIENIGKVLSREFLLKTVWGIEASLDTRTVDVHVSRVRRTLQIGPDMGYIIKTIYQHGYRLEKIH